MVDGNPGVLTPRLPACAFPHTALSWVPHSSAGSDTGREKGGQGEAGTSGQCVLFISVSLVASTVPGTELPALHKCL